MKLLDKILLAVSLCSALMIVSARSEDATRFNFKPLQVGESRLVSTVFDVIRKPLKAAHSDKRELIEGSFKDSFDAVETVAALETKGLPCKIKIEFKDAKRTGEDESEIQLRLEELNGLSFFVERSGRKLLVKSEKNGAENEALIKQIQARYEGMGWFGLGKFLKGKTLKKGSEVKVPKKECAAILGLANGYYKVISFKMTYNGIKVVAGKRQASFSCKSRLFSIGAGEKKIISREDEYYLDPESGRPFSISLMVGFTGIRANAKDSNNNKSTKAVKESYVNRIRYSYSGLKDESGKS